ncbi:hypothetical protein D3C77_742140 [compost metagenome]
MGLHLGPDEITQLLLPVEQHIFYGIGIAEIALQMVDHLRRQLVKQTSILIVIHLVPSKQMAY